MWQGCEFGGCDVSKSLYVNLLEREVRRLRLKVVKLNKEIRDAKKTPLQREIAEVERKLVNQFQTKMFGLSDVANDDKPYQDGGAP